MVQSEKSDLAQRQVFILRLWCRHGSSDRLHGQLQHVGSGEMTSIHDWEELRQFIESQVEKAKPVRPGKCHLK
ncbi:MAG: hypothetical protein AB1894_14550 [Chloroflexota bacterium]